MLTKLTQYKLDIKSLTLVVIETVQCGDEQTKETKAVT